MHTVCHGLGWDSRAPVTPVHPHPAPSPHDTPRLRVVTRPPLITILCVFSHLFLDPINAARPYPRKRGFSPLEFSDPAALAAGPGFTWHMTAEILLLGEGWMIFSTSSRPSLIPFPSSLVPSPVLDYSLPHCLLRTRCALHPTVPADAQHFFSIKKPLCSCMDTSVCCPHGPRPSPLPQGTDPTDWRIPPGGKGLLFPWFHGAPFPQKRPQRRHRARSRERALRVPSAGCACPVGSGPRPGAVHGSAGAGSTSREAAGAGAGSSLSKNPAERDRLLHKPVGPHSAAPPAARVPRLVAAGSSLPMTFPACPRSWHSHGTEVPSTCHGGGCPTPSSRHCHRCGNDPLGLPCVTGLFNPEPVFSRAVFINEGN